MSADPKPNPTSWMQLPPWVKSWTHQFGSKPGSPFIPLPADVVTGETAVNRPPFEMGWENQPLGLTVHFQERADGHLIAEVRCTYPNLLNTSAASVSVGGIVGEELPSIHKCIRFTAQDGNVRMGSADFGHLTEIAKKLGPKVAVILYLLV